MLKFLIGIKNFIKWFLDNQLIASKIQVWREFFMNAITFILLHVLVIQIMNGKNISNEFMMLISMVLAYYFGHKHSK